MEIAKKEKEQERWCHSLSLFLPPYLSLSLYPMSPDSGGGVRGSLTPLGAVGAPLISSKLLTRMTGGNLYVVTPPSSLSLCLSPSLSNNRENDLGTIEKLIERLGKKKDPSESVSR